MCFPISLETIKDVMLLENLLKKGMSPSNDLAPITISTSSSILIKSFIYLGSCCKSASNVTAWVYSLSSAYLNPFLIEYPFPLLVLFLIKSKSIPTFCLDTLSSEPSSNTKISKSESLRVSEFNNSFK